MRQNTASSTFAFPIQTEFDKKLYKTMEEMDMESYILVYTNGYQIEKRGQFDSLKDAQERMRFFYMDYCEKCKDGENNMTDECHIGQRNAVFRDAEVLHVWQILPVCVPGSGLSRTR